MGSADEDLRRLSGSLLGGLWWAVIVLCVAGAARTAWYAVGPPTAHGRLAAQVAWLNEQVAGSAPDRMQQLFPEGEVFTVGLTTLATARAAEGSSGAERARLTEEVTAGVTRLEASDVVDGYGQAGGLEHGVFVAGWQLHGRIALARLTQEPRDREAAVTAARRILTASELSDRPFLESYPSQIWPVDTIVAMAAVADVNREIGVPHADEVLARWSARARAHSSDDLLPHQLDPAGQVLDGPRGSSGALALSFLPSIDADWSRAAWAEFQRRFVTRTLGAVGIREFTQGSHRDGDVDSGPLLCGVSLSASAVGVAAARANGDSELATHLVRQAEIAGVPIEYAGQRRYALGLLPVGDAFLAWARSVPIGSSGEAPRDSPRPMWSLWMAPWLLGGTLALWRIVRRPARRRTGNDAPVTPDEGASFPGSPHTSLPGP